MVIINTADDFVRVLRENDDFRAAARRELLTEELLELPQRFDEYTLATDGKFDTLENKVDTLENKVDALRGTDLEAKMPTRLAQNLRGTLGLKRLQVMWVARGIVSPISRSERFTYRMEAAVEVGMITDDEQGRLTETDMVARALRETDDCGVWIAAEASGVINGNDIDRARASASALTKIYRQESIPVVYGYRIDDQQREKAEARNGLQKVHIFIETE